MALNINTNIGALNAAAAASSVNKMQETAMERLSTGQRINSAADDAAGMAISSRLTSEIRGTNQAIRNALDAQAMIDTAEGAHDEITNIMQRMRELAVQASNDTNSTQDRTNLDAEMQQLVAEIDRIAGVTTWAGQNLLDGSKTGGFNFQIGTHTGNADTLNVAVNSVNATALGLSGAGSTASASSSLTSTTFASSFNSTTDAITITAAATGQAAVTGQIAIAAVNEVQTISGASFTASDTVTVTLGDGTAFTATAGADLAATVTALNTASTAASAGVTFSVTDSTDLTMTFDDTGPQDAISITEATKVTGSFASGAVSLTPAATQIDGSTAVELTVGSVTLSATAAQASSGSALVTALQADADYDNSGFTIAWNSTTSKIDIVSNTGATSATLSDVAASVGTPTETTAGLDAQAAVTAQDAVAMETITIAAGSHSYDIEIDTGTYTTAAAQATQIASVLNANSDFTAQFTATANNGTISFTGLADTTFNVNTRANASAAITTLDAAINTVNTQRANLGAYSNRLDSTVSNLTNISTNLEAGRSRIQDADFAAESTNLAKTQILQQASTAMLAQANASKQGVLSLLQG